MSGKAIAAEQALQIMSGVSTIPPAVTAQVETMLTDNIPVVDTDQFAACLNDLMTETPQDFEETIELHYQAVVALGACSVEMAWQMAGDIAITRARRLHEHTQAVLNVFGLFLSKECTDPRDRIIKPTLLLQDIGKAHCVALADPSATYKSRDQEIHNRRFVKNMLPVVPNELLTPDEKTVIALLCRQNAIGTALGRYLEKDAPFDEVIAFAEPHLDELRAACPGDFRDRFDDYLLLTYLADAGAHTQRARFKDAATGAILPDITPEIRYNPDGSESFRSLDRIFSERAEDAHTIRLFEPKHLEVIRRLFRGHFA
jgi:hypothetical protein